MARQCIQCHTQLRPQARFCPSCGTAQPVASQGQPSSPTASGARVQASQQRRGSQRANQEATPFGGQPSSQVASGGGTPTSSTPSGLSVNVTGREFICPQCNTLDFGRYCSECSSSLRIGPEDFSSILSKWLIASGYRDVATVLQEGNLASSVAPQEEELSLIEILSVALSRSPIHGAKLLVFDRRNIKQMEVISIIDTAVVREEQLTSGLPTLVSELQKHEKILKKKFNIKRINVTPYLIYKNADAQMQVKNLRNQFPKKTGGKLKVHLNFVGINLASMSFYPNALWSLEPEKRNILFAVFRQLNLEETLKQEGSADDSLGASLFREIIHKPTESLQELGWLFVNVFRKPMHYAALIDEGKITFSDVLSYLALLTFFIGFVENVVGLKEFTGFASELQLPGNELPIVEEVYVFLLLLILSFVGSVIVHIWLKLLGGKGTFRQTFITQTVTMIVFLPLATLADVFVFLLSEEAYKQLLETGRTLGSRINQELTYLYAIPMLSVVHKISRKRIVFGYIAFVIGFFCLLILFFVVFLG